MNSSPPDTMEEFVCGNTCVSFGWRTRHSARRPAGGGAPPCTAPGCSVLARAVPVRMRNGTPYVYVFERAHFVIWVLLKKKAVCAKYVNFPSAALRSFFFCRLRSPFSFFVRVLNPIYVVLYMLRSTGDANFTMCISAHSRGAVYSTLRLHISSFMVLNQSVFYSF